MMSLTNKATVVTKGYYWEYYIACLKLFIENGHLIEEEFMGLLSDNTLADTFMCFWQQKKQ